MKEQIQKLIADLEKEKQDAAKTLEQGGMFGGIEEGDWLGRVAAYNHCIQRLNFILTTKKP